MSRIRFIVVLLTILLISIMYYIITENNEYVVVEIVGNSMYPTFKDGEIVEYSKSFKRSDIKRNDIVVFDNKDFSDLLLIKRVIGIPGDYIEIKDNILYLNGDVYKTESLNSTVSYFIHYIDFEVSEDEVFIIGDNYNDSMDSRYYGCVKLENIKGIVKE